MSLEGWDWFIKLAENESFTKAADELQISQQTLSARLVSLEKQLGAKLVVRGTPISFTPAGKVFLMYAREQRQAQRDMIRQIGEVSNGAAGVLKVGISHSRGRVLMPQVVARMAKDMPGVTVKLIEGTNRSLIRMAEHGELDAVIARFEGACPGVSVEPIYREKIVLAVHPDLLERVMGMPAQHAVQKLAAEGIGTLSKCPFVLATVDDISGRVAYSELRNAGIRPKVVAMSENLPTLLAMASQGIGAVFCFTDMLDVTPYLSGELVRIPLSAQASYCIGLGVSVNAEPWKAFDLFRSLLLEEVAGRAD